VNPGVACEMWLVLEPYHAAVYFAPEAKPIYEEAGLKGYWMGYFASRAAAMGAASPELVMATFYNFAPRMVRRAIPDAWSFSTPELVLAARHSLADIVAGRMTAAAPAEAVAEAADLAERAARVAEPEGRPLFAAHASLPWPDTDRLRLWHAATLLREHRGDGHVALLLTEDVGGCEAHILAAAAGAVDKVTQRQHRGWTDEEWAAADDSLRSRGLLDTESGLTEAGTMFKARLEDRTDDLALAPYDAIGEDGCDRLGTLMQSIFSGTAVPFPNAMGLPRK
jgi:helix-turn-helix protein